MAASTRTKFPLTGGDVSLTQSTNIDNLNILWYKGDNPTKFHSFSTYTNTITDIAAGHYCAPGPDFTSLGFSSGDLATLLLIYSLDGQETFYYQCADVELVDTASFTEPSFVCGNYTSELKVASSEDSLKLGTDMVQAMGTGMVHPSTGAAAAATAAANANSNSHSAKSSGLTAAQGGGIGAGVTLAVVALLLGALYAVGRVHFGRRQVTLDDSSSTNSIMKQRV